MICIINLLLQVGCKENDSIPEERIENLGGYKPKGNPIIDNWILNNLTKPFNVTVKYQYDPFEVDFMKNTAPAKQELVIPVMELVRKCMISPYIENSDSATVKKIIPKLWVLIGSAEYNSNGTMVLGQAEGANKITIMDINKFTNTREFVESTNYTVHHETAHILHQTKMYTPLFKFVNPDMYTTTWNNYTDKEAINFGFVRNYAMASSDEDFVETISYLLVRGQDAFDKLVSQSSAVGKNRLRLKEQYVVEYFNEKWSVNFRDLQKNVKESIDQYLATK